MTLIDYLQIDPFSFISIIIISIVCLIAIGLTQRVKKEDRTIILYIYALIPIGLLISLLIITIFLVGVRYANYQTAINEEYTVYVNDIQIDMDPLQAMKDYEFTLDFDTGRILCVSKDKQ